MNKKEMLAKITKEIADWKQSLVDREWLIVVTNDPNHLYDYDAWLITDKFRSDALTDTFAAEELVKANTWGDIYKFPLSPPLPKNKYKSANAAWADGDEMEWARMERAGSNDPDNGNDDLEN